MAFRRYFGNFFQEHKVLFTAVLIGLFILELEIFVIAASRSGMEHTLVISNSDGQTVYEAVGRDVATFNREKFELTFGSLDQYDVKRVSRKIPFPFRAWFVAAVGLPVGGMLLFAFVVRAFGAVFHGDESRRSGEKEKDAGGQSPQESRLYEILDRVGRLNIFAIGFFIFLLVVGYWVLPNAAVYLGRIGIDTVLRYRWFFLGGVVVLLVIFIWIVFLRFLLAKKHIESKTELEKYRIQLEYSQGDPSLLPPGLTSPGEDHLMLSHDANGKKDAS